MTTTVSNFEDKIIDLISNFDFEKVQAYMILTKWQWWNREIGDYYQPTIEDLKHTATDILCRVTSEGNSLIGSGGFYAYRFSYGIKLTFEPFRSSSF